MGDKIERAIRFEIGQNTTVDINGVKESVLISNVSFGGVLVESELRPEIGSKIKLIDLQMIETPGNVIRHTETGFALTMEQNKDTASFALKSITLDLVDDLPESEGEE